MPRLPLLTVLATALVAGTGCYSTYFIPRQELAHLDGYDVHDVRTVATAGTGLAAGSGAVMVMDAKPHRVVSAQGIPIDYNSTEELRLFTDVYAQSGMGGKFSAIHVTDKEFTGSLLNGVPVKADMSKVSHAEISVYNQAQSNALLSVIGTVLGAGIAVAVFAASQSN